MMPSSEVTEVTVLHNKLATGTQTQSWLVITIGHVAPMVSSPPDSQHQRLLAYEQQAGCPPQT
jgi:hypothetical protein